MTIVDLLTAGTQLSGATLRIDLKSTLRISLFTYVARGAYNADFPTTASTLLPPTRLLLLAIAAVLAMASVPVLVKSTSANEVTIGIARLAIAVLAFTPFVISRNQLLRLSTRDWGMLAAIGLVFGAHWLSYFYSIKLATASIGAMAVSTYGVQYLLLAWIIRRERLAPIECAAIGFCFLGCLVVAPEIALDNATTRGVLLGVFSALLYALLPFLHQRSQHLGTIVRSWGQFWFALLFFLPLLPASNWQLTNIDVYKLITLGLLCTVFAHGLWVKVSTELPALYTSLIYYLYVPISMLLSVALLGEALTMEKLIGAAMILTASVGITIYRWRVAA